jgi:ABC-type nitrate/sulfonate/bicarbonate transport system permease component
MRRFRSTADGIIPLVFIILLLAGWEYIVRLRSVPDYILPGPAQIVRTLIDHAPVIAGHARSTLVECLAGFAVAIVFSFIVAFLMDEIPLFRKAFYPLIVASQNTDRFGGPALYHLVRLRDAAKNNCCGAGVFFPIAISLLSGLASVDDDYLELFRSMQAGWLQIFRMVKLPLAMPSFFAGLRISAAYSVMGAVIGEWLGAKQGLGTYMTLSQRSFQVDRVFAAILAVTALSAALFLLVSFIERLVIPWNRLSEK